MLVLSCYENQDKWCRPLHGPMCRRAFFLLVYDGIDEAIQALKSKQVDGMLLDRYIASYYQGMDKLKSLITVKKFELQRDAGLLIANEKWIIARCLDFYRPEILRVLETVTDTLKVFCYFPFLQECLYRVFGKVPAINHLKLFFGHGVENL